MSENCAEITIRVKLRFHRLMFMIMMMMTLTTIRIMMMMMMMVVIRFQVVGSILFDLEWTEIGTLPNTSKYFSKFTLSYTLSSSYFCTLSIQTHHHHLLTISYLHVYNHHHYHHHNKSSICLMWLALIWNGGLLDLLKPHQPTWWYWAAGYRHHGDIEYRQPGV